MRRYRYLIVGGGMAAAAAIGGIREMDNDGEIGLIGSEPDAPYDRPPLSKGLWKGQYIDEIWRDVGAAGVQLHLGRTVTELKLRDRQAVDDTGGEYGYDRLLLATGGTPRRLPFGGDDVIYFRTVADYRRLKASTESSRRFVVIGGGFIGSEVAAALAMNGMDVTLIFPESAIGARVYPASVAGFLSDSYREKGVRLLPNDGVVGIERRGGETVVSTRDGIELAADGVVAGLGLLPNVELARQSGLDVTSGIVVDEMLRTSHPDVFAAGDVAEFYNPALDQRMRVEHEDNANTMGRAAGRAMAGALEPYHHLPFFYSDLFEMGYEAVGLLDSRLETVQDWKTPNREGVVYYLRDGRVRGVLLWNVWEQGEAARRVIAEAGPLTADQLRGRLGTPVDKAGAA